MDNILNELKKNYKLIIICISLICIFLIAFFITRIEYNNVESYYEEPQIEKYDANKIMYIYMDKEDIVKKYLNDYKNKIISNIDEAYNSLNKEYREKKFGNLDQYKKYINNYLSSKTYSMQVESYNETSVNGKRIYNIYDTSGNRYIFKENSIMNYEVYLDDNTVEIK